MEDAPLDDGLADERTTLAWQRSGLSLIVVAGLVARAALEAHALMLAIVAGGAVALLGAGAWGHGGRAYRRDRRPLAAGHLAPPVAALCIMAVATIVIAALATALVAMIGRTRF